ncbi:Serine/threonine-protein kinase 25 [Arthrobotrys conoides]|uniref:non-specific serine/threonine protein kinase n=1 Tax=Arthrobotrys conoides TaxID=74498 RepID=A0AAN8RS30_9PEZI
MPFKEFIPSGSPPREPPSQRRAALRQRPSLPANLPEANGKIPLEWPSGAGPALARRGSAVEPSTRTSTSALPGPSRPSNNAQPGPPPSSVRPLLRAQSSASSRFLTPPGRPELRIRRSTSRPGSSAGPSAGPSAPSQPQMGKDWTEEVKLPQYGLPGKVVSGKQLAENYSLLETLGRGAFGTVYSAVDKTTDRKVAIKVFNVESPVDDIGELQNEIGILSSLQHPNVTEHYVSFFKNHFLWIVMELVDYGSCAELISRSHTPSRSYSDEGTCKIILRETLKALVYIHENHLIHRDLKAANILLSSTGEVKLADFGVSARVEEHMPSKNTFVGTPLWMAPEIINTRLSKEKGYTSKIDIWSLGITAYELATGKPPHVTVNTAQALAAIGKGYEPKLPPDFSVPFQQFVGRCLKADPTLRPHAHELLEDPFFDDCPDKSELVELIQRYPRPPLKTKESEYELLPEMNSLASVDPGWDWNWGTIRSSTHFIDPGPFRPWHNQGPGIKAANDVDVESRRGAALGHQLRAHRRATSTNEVPAAGRKSMDARTPVSRPSTATNQPASRPSTGVKDNVRDRETTVKAGSFGRQLASAEVNARVAGHRAGRGQDAKNKLGSERSRHPDIGELAGSQGGDSSADRPRVFVRRGSRAQESKDRLARRESLGADTPANRPLPSSRPTSSRANTSYDVRDQPKFPVLERPQRDDYFGPEATTTVKPSSSRPTSSSQTDRLARSSNGSMPRHTLERQSSKTLDNDPFQSGFKTAAPHDSKGQLGRNAFDFVVKATIEELYYNLQPGKKRDVIKNLGKAWAELDAISPELELTVIRRLCRGMMEYPELKSVLLNDAREPDARSPQDLEDFSETPMSDAFRRSGSKSSQESLARSRRLAVLSKLDAEPLFATTKNEQMRNQHWHKAYRSSSALHVPQEPTIEESNPSTPTPQVVSYEVQAIEAKLRILQENMRIPSQSGPTDYDDLSPLDPSQKIMFDNLDRLRQESKPQLVALRHAESKETDESKARSAAPSSAGRQYLRGFSRETTPVADDEIRSILRSDKEKVSRKYDPKRPSFSYDGAGSDSESDGLDVVARSAAIDMTPSTPKIQRKRKSVVRINPNEEIVEIKPLPVKSAAPSPVKLFSPRTRLRQALLSDDEASPVQPSKAVAPDTPAALPEGARTPLMQKKITQLRSPEEIIEANVAKQPRSPVQSENVRVESSKSRLAFARKVEYSSPLPDTAAARPLGRRATRASLPSSKATMPNSRPRAKSTAIDPAVQLLSRTPGRKRSQSNLAEHKPLDHHDPQLDSPSSGEEPEELQPRPTIPALPRASRPAPTESFGPELLPARRLDRPIMRPISQPAARPSSARLGRPFTAHASAPALGANGATREPYRSSRSNAEKSEYQWQRRGDMKKLDDYLNGKFGANLGSGESAHRQQPTKAIFDNL